MSLDSLQTIVADAIRDKEGVIAPSALYQAIVDAVARYSADRPRTVVVDVIAPGGTNVPVPAEWDAGSELLSVETPTDADPPQVVDVRDVYVYGTPAGPVLRFTFSLAADAAVRVTHSTVHVVSGHQDTLPAAHSYGVACLAASMLCGQLAAYYATEGAPTIGADTADHQGKTERYRLREKDLRAEYCRIVGVPDRVTTPRAASATVELPSRDQFGDRRLFHPPARRPMP